MKRILTLSFSIFLSSVLVCATLNAETYEKIAVIDLKAENVSSDIIHNISETLRIELKSSFNVIPKNEMDEILNNSKWKKGCFTTDCLVLAGNLLNVNKIFTGDLAKVSNIFMVQIRIVDVKNRKVEVTKPKKCNNIKEVEEFIKTFAVEYVKQLPQPQSISPETTKPEVKAPTSLEEVKKYYGKETEESVSTVRFGLGGLFGYNYLNRGYDKYSNNFMFGTEFKIRLLSGNEIENLSYRLYFDYFPMIVPDGTYNLQEDIYNINIGTVYNFLPDKVINPFLGAGSGMYFDWIRYDTPASGYISNTYTYFGFNLSAGAEISIIKKISLVPEARIHFIMGAGRPIFLARNINYFLTFIYYF